MRRLIFWVSVASGVVAAVVMYRRGESLGTIAKRTMSNPVGALAAEVQNAL